MTRFDSSGLTFKLNFSDPLLVSANQQDEIEIRLQKDYFMSPERQEFSNPFRRQLQSISEDDEFIVIRVYLPA